MPTNTLQERMAEARATSEAQSIIRVLNDAVMDPNGPRFAKGRGTRIERWTQLEALARAQVDGLKALAKTTAKKPKVVPVPAETPLTPIVEKPF